MNHINKAITLILVKHTHFLTGKAKSITFLAQIEIFQEDFSI